jgi:hypothetical protein
MTLALGLKLHQDNPLNNDHRKQVLQKQLYEGAENTFENTFFKLLSLICT